MFSPFKIFRAGEKMTADEYERLSKDIAGAKMMDVYSRGGMGKLVSEYFDGRKSSLIGMFTSGKGPTEEIRGRLAEIQEFERWIALWPERGAKANARIEAAQKER